MNNNILVITGCSKKKGTKPAAAETLYQGQFFKGVVQYTKRNGCDLWILSAKHGLVPSTEIIAPYQKRIESKRDVEELRRITRHKIMDFLENYDTIFLLMGSIYRDVFEEFLTNPKIISARDDRGNGGFNQLAVLLNKVPGCLVNHLRHENRREISADYLAELIVLHDRDRECPCGKLD